MTHLCIPAPRGTDRMLLKSSDGHTCALLDAHACCISQSAMPCLPPVPFMEPLRTCVGPCLTGQSALSHRLSICNRRGGAGHRWRSGCRGLSSGGLAHCVCGAPHLPTLG